MDLQPGDIFATRGTGIIKWALKHLISPGTDRFHYGLIWRKYANDYIILESIFPKGITVGLLSWHKDEDLKFYRVSCPEGLRRRAPMALIKHGKVLYDVFLIPKLVLGYIIARLRLWWMWEFRPIWPEDIPYVRDSLFVCTEAVQIAYLGVGFRIIPKGVVPIPNSFLIAELRGRMIEITG